MKKSIVALMLVLSMSMTACSTTNQNKEKQETGSNKAPVTEKKEEAPKKDGKLTVYSSIYPVYDFITKIGGEKIESKMLLPMGAEAHDWEPSASDIAKLEDADMLVLNGGGFEGWAESIGNSLSNKDLAIVDTTKGIELMEGHHHHHDDKDEAEEADHDHDHEAAEKADHDHDHDHEATKKADHDHDHDHDATEKADHDHDHEHGLDPHVWTSPKLAKKQFENIYKALVEKDEKNADYYKENFEKYSAKFDQLDKKYSETISKLPGKDLVVSHEAFGYLTKEYGLTQIGVEGLLPESEPTPQTMAKIIDYIKDNKVKVIFFEETKGSKIADAIASQTEAKAMKLSTLESLSEDEVANKDDYFSIMERNLAAIKEALK